MKILHTFWLLNVCIYSFNWKYFNFYIFLVLTLNRIYIYMPKDFFIWKWGGVVVRRIPFLNLILHVKFHYNFFTLSKISFYIICKFHVKYRCTPSLIRFITNFGFLCQLLWSSEKNPFFKKNSTHSHRENEFSNRYFGIKSTSYRYDFIKNLP